MTLAFTACLAVSLDGRINPPGESRAIALGTQADRRHLQTLRDRADALIFGAGTFRSYPHPHQALNPAHRPMHCIVTRGQDVQRSIPPESPLFRETASRPAPPVWIFSACEISESDRAAYPEWLQWIHAPGTPQAQVAVMAQTLASQGIRAPMVEGGGDMVGLFLQARALTRLYLTLCPLLLGGGVDAPSLLSGVGFSRESAPRARLTEVLQRGDELFLTLDLSYPNPIGENVRKNVQR